MPQRRYWAPQELLWDEDGGPADDMAELQRINEQERAKTARDMLNVLNGPQRSPIAPGFARAPTSMAGMDPNLANAVREQQRRQNLLLGSAQAIAMLTGKMEGKPTNALPGTVNNITPGEQLPGTEGAPGAAEMLMRRQIGQGRMAPPAPAPTYDDYHDRFQNQNTGREQEQNPFDVARDEEWAKYQNRRKKEFDAERDAANKEPGSGYARDEFGRVETLAPEAKDEEERRRLEMERNWRRNMQWRMARPAPYR